MGIGVGGAARELVRSWKESFEVQPLTPPCL
jgi:hypothetical protein